MSGISRSAGYKAGAGKEEAALRTFESLLAARFKVSATRVTDAQENYEFGDFRFERGNTVECKGQPIDPAVYEQNFIEVFEDTSRGAQPHHATGFDLVAAAAGMQPDALAALPVRANPKRSRLRSRSSLGRLPFVSASIHTFVHAVAVAYVNSEKGIVALYESKQLLNMVRDAMTKGGLMRGAGRSNDDTFSVFVPYPDLIWERTATSFRFAGTGAGDAAEAEARKLFGV